VSDINTERFVWWLHPDRAELRNDSTWRSVFDHLCAVQPIPVRVDEDRSAARTDPPQRQRGGEVRAALPPSTNRGGKSDYRRQGQELTLWES
jgi:hypothetical protein